MLRRFHPVLPILLLVGLLATFTSLYKRWQAEGRSRAVALVLDYGQFRALTAATGVSPTDALKRFRRVGIRGMAVTEETLSDLQAGGMLQVQVTPTATGREYRLQ